MMMSALWARISSIVDSMRMGARSGYVSSHIWPNCMLNWRTRKRLISGAAALLPDGRSACGRSHGGAARPDQGFGIVLPEDKSIDLRRRRTVHRRIRCHGVGARGGHFVLILRHH